MRVLLQRVSRAEVRVGGEVVARSGPGLLLLVGIGAQDPPEQVPRMAQKVATLRIFEDADGKMNRSLLEVGGEVLVVPQFTLYGNTSRGRRPSWIEAAPPEVATERVDAFADALAALGCPVHRGAFGEHMEVELVNDGPVTLLLEG
ncbi:MAG TPA: D-aminoacyl-tRNA deacylase [Actinomycetota bacterium]|nr:D-aminoacyl-tRNA deacylase [Actinomycetota bacterium]